MKKSSGFDQLQSVALSYQIGFDTMRMLSLLFGLLRLCRCLSWRCLIMLVTGALTQTLSMAADQVKIDKGISLREELESIRVEFQLPALGGAIVGIDGVIESEAVGVRKIGGSTEVTVNDLWHLGSCTKAMTATMIGMLVDEGKLTWETKLVDLFEVAKDANDPRFALIELKHLLNHESGLPANGSWWLLGNDKSTTEQRKELLRRMSKSKLLHDPGSKFLYSNVGFALAGLMAEEVAGKPWESLMKERIFDGLKMNRVGFGIPGTIGEEDQPWGHSPTLFGLGPLKSVQIDNAPSLGPAGTVHASLDSWARFLAVHLKKENDAISDVVWSELHTPRGDKDYSYGWFVLDRKWAIDDAGEGKALMHNGSNTVNYCVCWLAPQRNFAVAVATNTGQKQAASAADKAASMLINRHLATLKAATTKP